MTRNLQVAALSFLSGALLFVSDYPLHAWPLQAAALLPFLFSLERRCSSRKAALGAGLVLGLANTLPLLSVLEFPLFMGLPLALYLSLLWMLVGLGIHLVREWPAPLGPLAAGAVAALIEWVDFTLVPVWGTAQSFARVWSAAPWTAQLVSAGGMTGLVFVLVSGQALIGRLLWGERRHRAAAALGLGALLATSSGWCAWSWTRPPSGEIKVAAIGWTAGDLQAGWLVRDRPAGSSAGASPRALFERIYRPLVEEAARRGAEIIASPEVGFFLGPAEEGEILAETARLARKLGRTLVIGYFSRRDNNNRAVLFDAEGALRADYTKSHLIAFIERYRAGPGRIVVAEPRRALGAGSSRAGASSPPAARVGLLICQDDNFTDLARAYGRAGAQLVVVPTNDWSQVKDFHLESSIFRAIENRYAVLRAASNGVSAVVSPRGEVLARRDHFRDGPGLVLARVPLGGGSPTIYSLVGDWPPFAGLPLLAFGWLRVHRSRRRRRSL